MEHLDFATRRAFETMIAVQEEWNQSNGPLLQVRESDIAWNITSQNLVSYRETRLAGVPVLCAVASPKGLDAGISSSSIWLTLWGQIPEGRERDFVLEFLNFGHKQEKSRFVIGGDEFHFVPGLPLGTPQSERLMAALTEAGFAGPMAADLIGDVKSEQVTRYISEGKILAEKNNWSLLPLVGDTEQQMLSQFLATEFPGRWSREFQFWNSREDTDRAIWMNMVDVEGTVMGFARLAVRILMTPAGFGWTPGALRLPLRTGRSFEIFDDHDGCLGPIGVAQSVRGQGAGRALLAMVLETLRNRNAGRICIDWTNAFKYYEPLRFSTERQYWTATKSGSN